MSVRLGVATSDAGAGLRRPLHARRGNALRQDAASGTAPAGGLRVPSRISQLWSPATWDEASVYREASDPAGFDCAAATAPTAAAASSSSPPSR